MESGEEYYLSFRLGSSNYIVPISAAVRIVPSDELRSDEFKELPMADIGVQAGTDGIILLQDEGRQFGLAADEVYGLLQIDSANLFDLPKELIDETNKFINGAAYSPDSDRIMFLLDGSELSRRAKKREE